MNKMMICAGGALLLAGCASVSQVKYPVTTFAEVPLAANSKIKIVAGSDLTGIRDNLKAELTKDGTYVITEDAADYWMILNGASASSTPSTVSIKKVAAQNSGSTGADVLERVNRNASSAAKIVSVGVYETATLTPVTYFEIPLYDGCLSAEAARTGASYQNEFSQDVVERIKDTFINQKKDVEVPVPKIASEDLSGLFTKGDWDGFAAAYAKFEASYAAENGAVLDIAQLCTEINTGNYKGKDAKVALANLYLNLLVKEAQTMDPAELEALKQQHLQILESSEAAGLVESVPVALQRLEYKLANVAK